MIAILSMSSSLALLAVCLCVQLPPLQRYSLRLLLAFVVVMQLFMRTCQLQSLHEASPYCFSWQSCGSCACLASTPGHQQPADPVKLRCLQLQLLYLSNVTHTTVLTAC